MRHCTTNCWKNRSRCIQRKKHKKIDAKQQSIYRKAKQTSNGNLRHATLQLFWWTKKKKRKNGGKTVKINCCSGNNSQRQKKKEEEKQNHKRKVKWSEFMVNARVSEWVKEWDRHLERNSFSFFFLFFCLRKCFLMRWIYNQWDSYNPLMSMMMLHDDVAWWWWWWWCLVWLLQYQHTK